MANTSIFYRVCRALGGTSLCLGGAWLLIVCGGGLLILGVASLLYVGVFFSLGILGVGLLMAGVCLIALAVNSPSRMNKIEDKMDWLLVDEMTERRSLQKPSSSHLPVTPSVRLSKNTDISSIRATSLNPFD